MNPRTTLLFPVLLVGLTSLLAGCGVSAPGDAGGPDRIRDLETGFENPPKTSRPETWFRLIGGNVNKPGLTADLEAVANAGLQGMLIDDTERTHLA